MATGLYDWGRMSTLRGNDTSAAGAPSPPAAFDPLYEGTLWGTHAVGVSLVHASYVVDLVAHRYFADVVALDASPTARVDLSSGTATQTGGVYKNTQNPTWAAVAAGAAFTGIVLWQWSGANATSPLLGYIDSTKCTGLPVTPNGTDITITWNASGILKI